MKTEKQIVTINYQGTTYDYRYAYKGEDGELMIVCDTSALEGERGNRIPASRVSEFHFSDGTVLSKEQPEPSTLAVVPSPGERAKNEPGECPEGLGARASVQL